MVFKLAPIHASNGQNPWGKPSSGQQKGPPEIEQLFKRFFSSGKSEKPQQSKVPTPEKPSSERKFSAWIVPVIIVILVVLWGFSGIYTVASSEQGAVLRFGKFVGTEAPGQHWYPRFIDQVYVVDAKPSTPLVSTRTLLTKAGDLVDAQFSVSYQVDNVETFLFTHADPLAILQAMVNQAAQQAVAARSTNALLGQNQATLEAEITQHVQTALQQESLGLSVSQIKVTSVTLPAAVQSDYTQVTTAQTAADAKVSAAQAYVSTVTPVATGKANALLAAANAYRQQAVLKAQMDIAAFQALLPVYKQYPEVTKTRLYFDAIQQVLQHSHVVVLDGGKKGNSYYLPLNETTQSPVSTVPAVNTPAVAPSPNTSNASDSDNMAIKQADYVRWQEAQP